MTTEDDLNLKNMSEEELEAYYLGKQKNEPPTRIDAAELLESGVISITTITNLPDHCSRASREVQQIDSDYEKQRQFYKLYKSGDKGYKRFLWIDNKWKLEEERRYW